MVYKAQPSIYIEVCGLRVALEILAFKRKHLLTRHLENARCIEYRRGN